LPLTESLSPGAINRRTFFDRTFSKIEKGSIRGGVLNLVSAALGGGVLSLSYVFVLSGYITGFILLCIGAIAAYKSNMMIAQMAIDHKLGNLD
jgi:amino acid permease